MTSLLSGDLTSRQAAAGLKTQHMDKGKILREGPKSQRDDGTLKILKRGNH